MLRFTLLTAWLIYAIPCMTQLPDTTLEQRVLASMSMIDYDSLITGIHIDRVPQYLPLRAFDGTSTL